MRKRKTPCAALSSTRFPRSVERLSRRLRGLGNHQRRLRAPDGLFNTIFMHYSPVSRVGESGMAHRENQEGRLNFPGFPMDSLINTLLRIMNRRLTVDE